MTCHEVIFFIEFSNVSPLIVQVHLCRSDDINRRLTSTTKASISVTKMEFICSQFAIYARLCSTFIKYVIAQLYSKGTNRKIAMSLKIHLILEMLHITIQLNVLLTVTLEKVKDLDGC